MKDVARLQCRGNGFILWKVDGKSVAQVEHVSDYVEVLPGRHVLVLMPGRELFDGSRGTIKAEWSEELYGLALDAKPNAWYHFCTYVIDEEQGKETVEYEYDRVTTRRSVLIRRAPFKVLEMTDGELKTVATDASFVRL